MTRFTMLMAMRGEKFLILTVFLQHRNSTIMLEKTYINVEMK